MEDMDKVQDYETMIAEMRAAGDANQRHLARVERSRGAISQIRYRSMADRVPNGEPINDAIADLQAENRYRQADIRRQISNEIIRAAYALGVQVSATDISFRFDNHAYIAGMPAVEWLYEAAVTDGTEEAADEVIKKLSPVRTHTTGRIGLVVSE